MKNHKLIIAATLACFSLLLVTITAFSTEPVQSAQTFRTRTPTRTPFIRRTPTPTRTPVVATLRRQLFWGGGGGGGSESVDCTAKMPRTNVRLPMIVAHERVVSNDPTEFSPQTLGGVCIFGMQGLEHLTLEIHNPSGKIVDRVNYTVEFFSEKSLYGTYAPEASSPKKRYQSIFPSNKDESISVITIEMWLPEGLPTGKWLIAARSDTDTVEGYFTVDAMPRTPVVNFGRKPVLSFPEASPLDEPREEYLSYYYCDRCKQGDKLSLYGANFKPGSSVPVGLYLARPFDPDTSSNIIDAIAEGYPVADRSGDWKITYTINSSAPPGDYSLVVVSNPDAEHVMFAGPHVSYEKKSWSPCEGTFDSHLYNRMLAKVNEEPPLANRVRNKPNRSASVLYRLQPGEEFKVVDGPVCDDKWIWWYVENGAGQRGWTAEGDGKTYWLSPRY